MRSQDIIRDDILGNQLPPRQWDNLINVSTTLELAKLNWRVSLTKSSLIIRLMLPTPEIRSSTIGIPVSVMP
jgi:hypothetical protein